jgi:aldehyde:ferredoxin oxidoreductase
MRKVIRVNTQTGAVTSEEFNEEKYRYFGNRGLIAKVMTDEVNPKCDPLGKENKFLLTTGIFSGTNLTTCHRLSAGGKSPLTGGIKEANVGGTVAYMLAGHGIKMVIIESIPDDNSWKLLVVDKSGKAELVPADDYLGLNNYDLVEKLKAKYGNKIAVASIGLAGERGYRNCSLQVTDTSTGHPSRAAARGGMGALLGAKKIKAIVIDEPTSRVPFDFVDKEKFENAAKRLAQGLTGRPSATTTIGTISVMDMVAPMALTPVNNYSGEIIDVKNLSKIDGNAFLKKLEKNGGKNQIPCQPGCVVRCSNSYNDSKGNYLTSGFEYETVAMCGANCMIYDLDTIAKMDKMCDDLGVDTIETGATIGVCMEAGKIPWGDKKGAVKLIQEMIDGTEFGKLMGQGTEAVGKKLGVKRIPTVKHQALSGYDPRNTQIVGITYSTSPMGADHTAGVMMMPDSDMMPKQFRLMMGANMQNNMGTCDNFMCMYAFFGTMGDPTILPDLMSGAFGGEWDTAKINEIGSETVKLERAFNKAAGFTVEDNALPEFFYEEPAPSTGAIFNLTKEEMSSAFA